MTSHALTPRQGTRSGAEPDRAAKRNSIAESGPPVICRRAPPIADRAHRSTLAAQSRSRGVKYGRVPSASVGEMASVGTAFNSL